MFSASSFDRISRLLSGVRSSCDMLARNSDLYFEVSASCSAFSSSDDARLLDLAVLLLDLHVLLREQLGLLFQLLVGLLQLFLLLLEPLLGRLQRARLRLQAVVGLGQLLLPGLQLDGERLRLLQQLLGPHRRGDGVEDDADAFGELVEEGQVDVAEAVERGQLDHRLDLAFEQHRQHDDVQRLGFAEAGADLDVVGRARWSSRMLCFSSAAWPTSPSPALNRLARFLRSV